MPYSVTKAFKLGYSHYCCKRCHLFWIHLGDKFLLSAIRNCTPLFAENRSGSILLAEFLSFTRATSIRGKSSLNHSYYVETMLNMPYQLLSRRRPSILWLAWCLFGWTPAAAVGFNGNRRRKVFFESPSEISARKIITSFRPQGSYSHLLA